MTTIQKSRGYRFEKKICELLVKEYGGIAWRLGGTQIELPDVLWVNNETSQMMAVECKSVATDRPVYIRKSQVERCLRWCNNLNLYRRRSALLACKFPKAIYWYDVYNAHDYAFYPTGRVLAKINGRYMLHRTRAHKAF